MLLIWIICGCHNLKFLLKNLANAALKGSCLNIVHLISVNYMLLVCQAQSWFVPVDWCNYSWILFPFTLSWPYLNVKLYYQGLHCVIRVSCHMQLNIGTGMSPGHSTSCITSCSCAWESNGRWFKWLDPQVHLGNLEEAPAFFQNSPAQLLWPPGERTSR